MKKFVSFMLILMIVAMSSTVSIAENVRATQ